MRVTSLMTVFGRSKFIILLFTLRRCISKSCNLSPIIYFIYYISYIVAHIHVFSFLGTAEPCESGWTFDGVDKCWKVLETPQTFDAAKISCEAENAKLGIPNEFIIDNVVCLK